MPKIEPPISQKLSDAATNLTEAKDKMTQRAEELGYQAQLASAASNFWREIEENGYGVPQPITVSGNYLADSFLGTAKQLNQPAWFNQFDAVSSTASTTSLSMYGTMSSFATISLPPQHVPQSYYQAKKIVEQHEGQSDLESKLRSIDPVLATQYSNAWENLRVQSVDPARAPMFLIREVLRVMYQKCAPDAEVMRHEGLADAAEIKRSHRVNYLSSKIPSQQLDALEIQEKAFKQMYAYMSAAHAEVSLSYDKTVGSLYQANAIIRLLVEFYEQVNTTKSS